MTIQKATQGDLRAMAEVAAAAFMEEELWGPLLNPRRKEYPEDFIYFFQTRFMRNFHDPSRQFLVGVDDSTGRVVAYVIWERQGFAVDSSSSWGKYLSTSNLLKGAAGYYCDATNYIWPNRAADPTKANVLKDAYMLYSHLWVGHEKNWYCDMLATHPDFQGRGIAAELVRWGVQQADEEKIGASVTSSFGNESFYAKFGFVEVGRANVGPLEENKIKGGAVMFRKARM